MEIRLQKVIADSGLASRRKAEEWIVQGRVTVNGQVVRELGTKVDTEKDHVKVDGRHLKAVPPSVFLMLNKPKGYMSSLSDPASRLTIMDLLDGVGLRVFPVGRLDFDSEGLMLLTNQGELAQALLHPRYHVPKTYLIKVKGVLTDEEIELLEKGVDLEDGRTGPAFVKKIRKAQENSWLEITIHEGRKHQVKRMLESVGHPVIKLTRVRFGPLSLGDLARGQYRYLTDREANALRALVRERLARGEGFEAKDAKPSRPLPRRAVQGRGRAPRPLPTASSPRSTRSSGPAPRRMAEGRGRPSRPLSRGSNPRMRRRGS
ncbi:MAG: pseudouridine synthase [Nitrospira sp.]|nr:pseudouridine synthase [Nitrospira sp.]